MSTDIRCNICLGRGEFGPDDVTTFAPHRPWPVKCPVCKGDGKVHEDQTYTIDGDGEVYRVADYVNPSEYEGGAE